MTKFFHVQCSVLVFLVYLSTIRHASPMPIQETGLYNATDNIVLLNVTNIKSTILASKSSWIVEFYSSWCGHCQRFAPVWKSFAKDVLAWKGIVTVGAIDCKDEYNIPVCREFEVLSYPTIKFISMRARPDSVGVEIRRLKSAEGLKAHLINQLQKEQQEGRGQTWPNIIPYKSSDTANLWKSVPSTTDHIFLIFEQPDSTIGAEVILDFHANRDVHIRLVYSTNEPLCIAHKVKKFPSIVVLNRDHSQTKINVRSSTREFCVDAIKEFLGLKTEGNKNDQLVEEQIQQSQNENRTEESVEIPDILYQADLDKTLRYSLYNEIPISAIDGPKLLALKNYLALLQKLYPFGKKGRDFIKFIRDSIEEKSSVSGKQFQAILTSAETNLQPLFSENLNWVGCKGSSEKFRGYPCGLWSMFHMLTVNRANSNESGDPAEVLKVIHGYVKNFFGCWDCSEHFLEMAERRKMLEVEGKNEAVLWLWSAHNEVNERLAGDLTEDPVHKKVQYPSIKECPECRYGNGSWNQDRVLSYLKNKYSYIDSNQAEESTSEETRPKTKRDYMSSEEYAKRKSGWDFTIFDISICVVLYVASTFILMLVCIKFAVKRNYRKKVFLPSFLVKT